MKYSELSNGCGGTILLTSASPEAEIKSPNYPNSPPPQSECVWTVIAPAGERIHLDLDNLDVKPSRG